MEKFQIVTEIEVSSLEEAVKYSEAIEEIIRGAGFPVSRSTTLIKGASSAEVRQGTISKGMADHAILEERPTIGESGVYKKDDYDQQNEQQLSSLILTLTDRISNIEMQHIEISRAEHRRLNAGLLSKFSMVASDISCVKQLINQGKKRGGVAEHLKQLYLELLESALTGYLYDDPPMDPWQLEYDPNVRTMGWDWPRTAQTMIGRSRLRNIRELAEQVIREKIPGDFLEAGVWRGGACIYMRGILAAYNIKDRKVWAADSFQGLPIADPDNYPVDRGDMHHEFPQLAVTLDEVKKNFERYSLLDRQIMFLPGWFKDTLPNAPVSRLAILRLDGDMYESTTEALEGLYSRLSLGGFVIIDDYILEPCKQAVHDFRAKNRISDEIREIDGSAVFWRRSSPCCPEQ